MQEQIMADGKTSQTSKLFAVLVCGRCGHIIEHTETEEYSECNYEADKMLTGAELIEALNSGNVVPKVSGLTSGCESCIDSPAFQEEN
jgi:hypothetical protein